jgi:D-alanine-D-alanine ligase-like ATP-grasp enzyme
MDKKKGKNFCQDCGMPSIYHIQTWLDELTDIFLPRIFLPRKLKFLLDALLDKIFITFKLASWKDDFRRSDIQLRSTCFIEEARKKGVIIKVLKGPFGYTNQFRAEISNKIVRFEGLSIADFASKYRNRVDDKERTRQRLKKGNFPVAQGKAFWFFQKKRAMKFGAEQLGFPLVVKPRSGSVSRHVTTNIKNPNEFKKAIHKAIIHSPAFIIERFIANAFVYRATVVDLDFVACVKQMPANVVGDGFLTVQELINEKNNDQNRGEPCQKEYTLYKIVENQTTKELLSERGYNFQSIPKKDEIVYLQRDPFLKLGGDLVEVTEEVHPDNFQLFRQVASFFDIKVVGIDFLASDISRSWKNQQSAILELNSLPCIELHHFPSSGRPQNVAKAVADLFFKYYL